MDNSTQKPNDNVITEFMNHLKDLIKEPPYLMFYFISSTFLIISLVWQEKYFGIFLILLIYSVIGVVWRHAIKDLRGRLKEKYSNKLNTINLWLTGTYQLVNIILIIFLVILLLKYKL